MTSVVAMPAAAPAPVPARAAEPLRLLISCPDRPGIVAAVSRFLFEAGANIVRSDQYSTDPEGGTFFLRMEFTLPEAGREGLAEWFGQVVAERFDMQWRLWDSARRKRVAVLVSRYDRTVLARAVRWHCEDRVIRHGHTTVVF